jgi:hypothetical protein
VTRRLGCAGALCVVLSGLAGVGCTIEEPIDLDLSSRFPIACEESPGVLLASRAFRAPHDADDVEYVFDVVRTGAEADPRCLALRIAEHCAEFGCEAIPELRRCVRIPRATIERVVEEAAGRLETLSPAHFLEGSPRILDDVPDEPAAIRLTIALAPPGVSACDGAGAPIAEELLLGCGYTCPAVLGGARMVSVDLDPIAETCDLRFVSACAEIGLVTPW